MKKETKLDILKGIFFASIILANLIAIKIGSIFGYFVTMGIIVYPITFLMTDLINECWGKSEAKKTVIIGFLLNVFVVIITQIAIRIPNAPFYDGTSFSSIFGFVPRIVIASMIAYLISQTHDVWSFNFWRKLTKDKHLWLRNNLSTMSSQAIDTVIFITIGFFGIIPIVPMIITQYVMKLIIAVLDTPLIYLGRWWINENSE